MEKVGCMDMIVVSSRRRRRVVRSMEEDGVIVAVSAWFRSRSCSLLRCWQELVNRYLLFITVPFLSLGFPSTVVR